MSEQLKQQAQRIIEFYGEPTVAADFAREVLQFLQSNPTEESPNYSIKEN